MTRSDFAEFSAWLKSHDQAKPESDASTTASSGDNKLKRHEFMDEGEAPACDGRFPVRIQFKLFLRADGSTLSVGVLWTDVIAGKGVGFLL